MKAEFLAAFTALKAYLSSAVPELGKIITHYEKPLDRNLTILLPDKTSGGQTIVFTVFLKIHTFEKNAEAIAAAQIRTAEQLFAAVYPGLDLPAPIITAAIKDIDFFDPTSQAPNIGVMAVLLDITLDYLDDCGA